MPIGTWFVRRPRDGSAKWVPIFLYVQKNRIFNRLNWRCLPPAVLPQLSRIADQGAIIRLHCLIFVLVSSARPILKKRNYLKTFCIRSLDHCRKGFRCSHEMSIPQQQHGTARNDNRRDPLLEAHFWANNNLHLNQTSTAALTTQNFRDPRQRHCWDELFIETVAFAISMSRCWWVKFDLHEGCWWLDQ
jgi:hypothetical protein